jgi:hypothetical protein
MGVGYFRSTKKVSGRQIPVCVPLGTTIPIFGRFSSNPYNKMVRMSSGVVRGLLLEMVPNYVMM